MLLIAENLNAVNRTVADSLTRRDGRTIAKLVLQLQANGAQMLDLNLGYARKEGPASADWLVRQVAAATRLPLSLDTAHPAAMRAGLEAAAELGLDPPLINSFSLDPVKVEQILPLAAEFRAPIVGYCVRDVVPRDPDERLLVAAELVDLAERAGVPREHLYLDPILFPLMSYQDDVANVLEFLRAIPQLSAPPVRTMVGLSNFSHGLPKGIRWLPETVLIPMLAALDLDAVMLNVLEPRLMDAAVLLRAVAQETVFSPADLQQAQPLLRNG